MAATEVAESSDYIVDRAALNLTTSNLAIDTTTIITDEDEPTYQECLKSKMVWVIYFMAALSVSKYPLPTAFDNLLLVNGLVTVDVYKIYGSKRPNLDHEGYLTQVSSFSAIFNSLRFVWSAALDRFSYKVVYGTLLVMEIILAFTFKWSANSMYTYALWVWLSIWTEGGHFCIVPNILK